MKVRKWKEKGYENSAYKKWMPGFAQYILFSPIIDSMTFGICIKRLVLLALVMLKQDLPVCLQLGSYLGYRIWTQKPKVISPLKSCQLVLVSFHNCCHAQAFANRWKSLAETIPSGCFSSSGHPRSRHILITNQW